MNLQQMQQIATDLGEVKERLQKLEERRLPATYAPQNFSTIDVETGETVNNITTDEITVENVTTNEITLEEIEAEGEGKDGTIYVKKEELFYKDKKGVKHKIVPAEGGGGPTLLARIQFETRKRAIAAGFYYFDNITQGQEDEHNTFKIAYVFLIEKGESTETKARLVSPYIEGEETPAFVSIRSQQTNVLGIQEITARGAVEVFGEPKGAVQLELSVPKEISEEESALELPIIVWFQSWT